MNATPAVSQDEKTLALVSHLLAFAGYLVPFGNLIGPLVIWLVKRDTSSFVGEHARESLNFQITVTLAALVCIPLCFVLIGFALLLALVVFEIVQVIKATVAASEGRTYHYPYCLRLVS